MKELSDRSRKILSEVHPALAAVIEQAAAAGTWQVPPLSFIVTEGMRTLERQKQLMAAGASKTLKSRHLTGHAVDLAVIVGGEVRWDWPLYSTLAGIVKAAAHTLDTEIEWGGDWKSFKDGPHFQLSWKAYPL